MYLAFRLPIKETISSPLGGGYRFCAGATRTICELVIPDELTTFTRSDLLRDAERRPAPQPGSLQYRRFQEGRQIRLEVSLGPERGGLDLLVFGADTGFAPYLPRIDEGHVVWGEHFGVRLVEAGASGAGEWGVMLAHLEPVDPPLVLRWGRNIVFVFHPDGRIEELSTIALIARLFPVEPKTL